ncbi:hypothetical protein K438DRAFT_921548 [Mycena galopus ATCC 62051]|nr:hypothetical protein K438DRAFT_921548 [Mycena galopus ATCC 62051]
MEKYSVHRHLNLFQRPCFLPVLAIEGCPPASCLVVVRYWVGHQWKRLIIHLLRHTKGSGLQQAEVSVGHRLLSAWRQA